MLSKAILLASIGGSAAELFCPSANDFIVAYHSAIVPTLVDQGWTSHGGAGVATKSSFNLLGGWVEYDIDFSQTKIGVNANVFTVSPQFKGSSFVLDDYCDAQKTGAGWCLEVDWIETNGACGGSSTLHTVEGRVGPGCNANGCTVEYKYTTPSFRLRHEYTADGHWTTTRNGVSIGALSPAPRPEDWAVVQRSHQTRGAVIYASQWVGWVPAVPGCNTQNGDLVNSIFSVKNLRVNGTLVQGPRPKVC